jgi:hypothetical protein
MDSLSRPANCAATFGHCDMRPAHETSRLPLLCGVVGPLAPAIDDPTSRRRYNRRWESIICVVQRKDRLVTRCTVIAHFSTDFPRGARDSVANALKAGSPYPTDIYKGCFITSSVEGRELAYDHYEFANVYGMQESDRKERPGNGAKGEYFWFALTLIAVLVIYVSRAGL